MDRVKDQYYVLIRVSDCKSWFATVLKPLADQVGVTTVTMRSWLREPEIALKRGYIVSQAYRLKSKQGGPREGAKGRPAPWA
jgi:hypothetical protein